ncbi:hypothetical protein [Rossellomorea marisflavi]|uniref:hypothetical protein n=1 Tax=Rossellomorea marisflavi TaxID=189381 RepID=UPI0016538C68|nr:hypothetical protein [Rossellomorea marisflavi]
MENKWIKFDYDDGADVYYQIDPKEETVSFKKKVAGVDYNPVTIFFDELEEVFKKTKSL